jgi:hypothetical protein
LQRSVEDLKLKSMSRQRLDGKAARRQVLPFSVGHDWAAVTTSPTSADYPCDVVKGIRTRMTSVAATGRGRASIPETDGRRTRFDEPPMGGGDQPTADKAVYLWDAAQQLADECPAIWTGMLGSWVDSVPPC